MSFYFDFSNAKPRERFAVLLLIPVTLAMWITYVIGGLLAPGWTGVGSELMVQRWRWWGTITSLSATTLGVATCTIAIMAILRESQISRLMRFVSVFSAGHILLLSTFALQKNLEINHLLILSTATVVLAIAATVDTVNVRAYRWVGVFFALFTATAILRIVSWWLFWSVTKQTNPLQITFARWLVTASLVCEAIGQLVFFVALIRLSKWRGALSAILALGAAFAIAYWTLGTTLEHQGTFRDAIQRTLSLRIQNSGLLPVWVDSKNTMPHELTLLDPNVRMSFLPSLFLELSSITLALAAIVSFTTTSYLFCCTFALVLLSRAQIDVPLRALGFCIAALMAILFLRNVSAFKSTKNY